MAEQAKTISFRLSGHQLVSLEKRAEKLTVSPGDLARKCVVQMLDDEQESDLLRLKLSALENEVKDLRRGINNMAEALLVVSGKVTKEQAKEWVKENIG